MALIKLNIADTLLSESAAKKPSYKIAKVGGAQTLVVSSAKKAELQAVLGLLKKAKTAAVSGMVARIKAATAYTKSNQTPKGPRKTALRENYKTEKAKASADIKQAKALIREANSHAKKHGLGGLNLPLSATDIVLAGPGLAKALKAVRSTKLTEFGVTGKRGAFKPKFVKEAAFDALGSKTTTKAAKTAKAPVAKKPSHAEALKRVKDAKKPKKVSAVVDKPFKDVFQNVTTTQFSAKWARENWKYRRVGNKIVMDNPGQLLSGVITPGMAKRNGTTVDKIEQQLRDLKVPEDKKKRVARKPKPLTQYNA